MVRAETPDPTERGAGARRMMILRTNHTACTPYIVIAADFDTVDRDHRCRGSVELIKGGDNHPILQPITDFNVANTCESPVIHHDECIGMKAADIGSCNIGNEHHERVTDQIGAECDGRDTGKDNGEERTIEAAKYIFDADSGHANLCTH